MGMRQNKSGREQSKYKGALFDYQHVQWELLYVLLRIHPFQAPLALGLNTKGLGDR